MFKEIQKVFVKVVTLDWHDYRYLEQGIMTYIITGDEAFKSICRVLGPRAKKPTLGVQHAKEAGYLFNSMLLQQLGILFFLS